MRTLPDNACENGHGKRNRHFDSLGATLSVQDRAAHAHGRRAAGYARLLGRHIGLSSERLLVLTQAVTLHDLGKMHIPTRILTKSEPLTHPEWQVMKSHVVIGYAMLSALPGFEAAADIVLAHHERYDGTGYPHRLEGDEIPLGARICALADSLDALTAVDQPYRRPLMFSEACRHIASQSGRCFDPDLVDVLLSLRYSGRRPNLAPEEDNKSDFASAGLFGTDGPAHFDNAESAVIAC